jgi:hypothetical protein
VGSQWIEGEQASQWSFLIKGWAFLLFGFGALFLLPTASTLLSWDRLFPLPTYVQLPEPVYQFFCGIRIYPRLVPEQAVMGLIFRTVVRLAQKTFAQWPV